MALLDGLLNIIAPKRKLRAGGQANTPTYNPQQNRQVLTYPQYRDHLDDLFGARQSDSAPELLKRLFQHDPDVSSAVNGYLTLANTDMIVYAEDLEGNVDPEASRTLHALIKRLGRQTDYTQGFRLKQNLYQLNAELRYMLLMRGGIAIDLVYDKTQAPDELRVVDLDTIRWYETQPGLYKPGQLVQGTPDPVMLDSPSFFVSFYRRDPTSIYANSPFVSAINTIASRQQVINDLYRIMRFTGYPRMDIKVLESVLIENAPADVRSDASKMKQWVADRMSELATQFANISVDQALVHPDTVDIKILNEKNPGMGIDISQIIDTLNAQNQAGLKTMATILGRGSAGVNTSSVEARLAAMFADELNEPLADIYERIFSFALHQTGYQGFAVVKFRPAELRPATELEPQLVLKANRLRQDLSDGIISDAEYALEMYGRLPNPDAPELSGTGFLTPAPAGQPGMGPEDVSPNSDSVGRDASPDRTAQTRANQPRSRS